MSCRLPHWVKLIGYGLEVSSTGMLESIRDISRILDQEAQAYARTKLIAIEDISGCKGELEVATAWPGS